ncbi:MAG: hypothetical protein KA739_08630 [Pseudomonadales bacterium]|jgi:hypothetical protein|nr:hypothetical protein [Gammaproteobacteria bacterium]MBK9664577.1 hypothetical protein [Gammaproteobacteria bacterium]MBP6051896.1 hypothetical protein [Pseudomonadales bacterium]MBP6227486.1 hypothetical protein [Pseudomonadales bacterium]
MNRDSASGSQAYGVSGVIHMLGTAVSTDARIPGLALAISDVARVKDLAPIGELTASACLTALGWQWIPFAETLAGHPIDGIHFGNEFCERLLPTSGQLKAVVEWCRSRGLSICLCTPMLADKGIAQLGRLLPLLPAASEVVCNDFGTLRLLMQDFASLHPVAGRQMCKMIKDPRLPSADWAQAIPPGLQSSFFSRMLHRFRISRMETEVRPFAETTDFRPNGLDLSVHIPFGYTLKGRICRPGSLHLPKQKKFTPGHSCQKECLSYFSTMERTAKRSQHELETFMRGNTVFYRYAEDQERALGMAIDKGWISRLILAGDWNENRRAN